MIKEGIMIGGRYEIIGRIGMGGMADVYKATDRVLSRYVAVKVLKREFREDESFVKKFRSEARAAAGLTHPNIVNVYDVAEDRGLYYIVMELVEGITLKEYIQKKGKLSPKEVIGITLQVCAGIDAAHSNNIIHRDIKPQNIMISKEGKVKVTDFGIAKATSSNTISTNAMGSVHYTSPEQARGGFSDEKSDIYSLGVTMYEMITGALPFDGDSTVSIALKHLQEDIVPPSEFVPDMPYSLEQIILKCMQKSSDRRYADVAALARDLKRSIQDPDGDFVRISPLVSVSDTVMITPEEMENIQRGTKYRANYEDDYYDDYYEDEERRRRRQPADDKKSDINPKMSKVMKILTIVAASLFVLIMGYLLISTVGFFKGGSPISSTTERNVVPELIGKSLEDAKAACINAGLTLVVADDTGKSLEYDKDYVYRQLTQSGTKMPEGGKVQVFVSAGLKDIEMPDVVGDSENAAVKELKSLGFKEKNIEIEYEEHATVKKDDVIRTNPKAGKVGNSKTKIIVYVSKGVGKTEVPELVGKTVDVAKNLLTEASLKVEIEEVPNEKAAGTVLEQSEAKGTKVDKQTTIKLKVSKGNTEKVPLNLEGKTLAEAKKILEDLGFKVKYTKIPSPLTEDKVVVTSVDNAGIDMPRGATIRVEYKEKTTTENSGATTTP